ncbi:2-oxo-4-hydroxy-4-carboxy-5-ureidoimidazoline decarboxylase [Streptomyces physcomitrii]|uniref:2-oxo-4-hydroxy-4-carboxy-5-ureidoimidazoline decarboxylase n=1 Tax=Streptomyces physcomitrii TaxID=2724184 RepID=UPI000AAD60D8
MRVPTHPSVPYTEASRPLPGRVHRPARVFSCPCPSPVLEHTLHTPRLPRGLGPRAIPSQGPGDPWPRGLQRFNTTASEAAEVELLACLTDLRWARRLARHRPYPDLSALLAAADEATYDLTPADLMAALAREPRATLPPRGSHSAAHTALTAAHAAYEHRFGHVFVLCLDGFPPEEALDQVLHGIRSRLGNDPEEERVLAAEELRRLARGRITRMLSRHHRAGESQESTDSGHSDSPYVQV